jgi:hypothetical protein
MGCECQDTHKLGRRGHRVVEEPTGPLQRLYAHHSTSRCILQVMQRYCHFMRVGNVDKQAGPITDSPRHIPGVIRCDDW